MPVQKLLGELDGLRMPVQKLSGTLDGLKMHAQKLSGTLDGLRMHAQKLSGTLDGLRMHAQKLSGTLDGLRMPAQKLSGILTGQKWPERKFAAGRNHRKGGWTEVEAISSLPEAIFFETQRPPRRRGPQSCWFAVLISASLCASATSALSQTRKQ